MDSEKLTKELKKRGIPFTIMKIGLMSEQEEWEEELKREIWEYLMQIEEFPEKTADSTLIFGDSRAPNYFGALLIEKKIFGWPMYPSSTKG